EARVFPEVDVLIERAELRRPGAGQPPVVVAADLAADLGVELQIFALLARIQRVGAQLVDHASILSLTGTADTRRPRNPCAADGRTASPGRAGCAADPGGRRRGRRTCRSTRAPSSRRPSRS